MQCTRSQIQLDDIAEVKHELLLPGRVVFVGYNTESLRRNELLYEVHDVTTGKKTSSGKLPIFGISFLTPYIRYKGNTFINLIGMSGRKIIQVNDFEHNLRTQLVKTIDYKDYQLKPVREKYGLFCSGETVMLVEITESPPIVNVVVRSFGENGVGQIFRVVSFDPIPKFYFGGKDLYFVNEAELTQVSPKLQPNYSQICNWQNIRIMAIHQQLIIAFTDSSDYFCLSFTGKVVQLAQNVKAMAIFKQYIALITQPSQFQKCLLIMQYSSSKHRYQQHSTLTLPIQCRNSLLFDDWIKVQIDSSTENNRHFLRVELEGELGDGHRREGKVGL